MDSINTSFLPPETSTSSFATSSNRAKITYRGIQKSDRDILQQLHEEFFPVKYSQSFYDGIVNNKGIHGMPLYSVIALNEAGEIVGFILAQLFDYPSRAEDIDLFAFPQQPKQVFYILTLGLKPEYRRYGIASNMIKMCINYASSYITCGAVSDANAIITILTSFLMLCDVDFRCICM